VTAAFSGSLDGGERCALVVDDDTVSRLVLAHMLRRAGWEVEEADDVAPARELLAQRHFTVVFSDFSMPGGTGMDLMASLGTPRPLFVLVTGIVQHSEPTVDPAHRADAHLTKPISTRELQRCLSAILPAGSAR
jgi:CheY-like chemotaxis protein